jgi:hypothetical protein
MKELTDKIIIEVAHQNNIEPASLKAICMVESDGNGFLPDGRCKILFEGHIFWRQLVIAGITPSRHVIDNQDILYEVWDKSKYKGGAAEYDRLAKAMKIHRIAALKSASYGLFQIMGFNHNNCGYQSIDAFVNDMNDSVEKQLQAAVLFLKSKNLIDIINQHNWKAFANMYNGPMYAKNNYDVKLEQAYRNSLQINEIV